MGDYLRTGKPSRYETSHLGQLSLPYLWGREIEYWLVWQGVFTCVGWQVTLCDPMWQATLPSCEIRVPLTAIHYLYLFLQ